MSPEQAEAMQRARRLTGEGLGSIASGMKSAGTDDALLGALYSAASCLAVKINGDRHAWNLSWARNRYNDFKDKP